MQVSSQSTAIKIPAFVHFAEIIRIEERGCAKQSYLYHKWVDEGYTPMVGIKKEIYQEGCFPENFDGLKASRSTYCYCSSNLCNSAKPTSEISFFHHTDAMSVIVGSYSLVKLIEYLFVKLIEYLFVKLIEYLFELIAGERL